MLKYLKKLILPVLFCFSVMMITKSFLGYLTLDWKVNYGLSPVASTFEKFKHIKYPKIFSNFKNLNIFSDDAKKLRNEIEEQEIRIVKIYQSASSLFYLDYLPIKPIEKDFRPLDPLQLAKKLEVKPPTLVTIEGDSDYLSLEKDVEVYAYKIEVPETVTSWTSLYDEIGIEAEILAYADFFKETNDEVKLVQSATERSSKKPEDMEESNDELVFFSYQEEEKAEPQTLSQSVLKAIEREFKENKIKKVAKSKTVGGYPVTTPEKERKENTIKYKAKSEFLETEIITVGVKIDKGFIDHVAGIEFVPHYDKNERFYDEAEGVIKISASQEISTHIYGTILSKDFVSMRTNIPLFLGGGVFELPLIQKDALNELLDREKLNGLGSFLLVDLGDSAIDVDIDKKFEARTYLSEEFKITTQESSYKYILYVGVEPGNTVIKYLDSSGNTFEKLSFLAETEMTYEYFVKEAPLTFKFETFEINPLSKKAKELSLTKKKINRFARSDNPDQVGLNSFKFENFVSLKSSNNYLEFSHLGNSIFAGMRLSNYVVLPSASFVDSILKAEGVGQLEHHCMIQLNLSNPVGNILYDGEDSKGPMEVRLHYLDEDGVLSEEPSLLTKHAFVLGSGQGVINMKVEFLNKTNMVIQSFCSNGTYLVEQL